MHSQPVDCVTKLVWDGSGASPSSLLCSKIPGPHTQPGFMTSPWKYSGQLVPQGRQPGGTAAAEHPAPRTRADITHKQTMENG